METEHPLSLLHNVQGQCQEPVYTKNEIWQLGPLAGTFVVSVQWFSYVRIIEVADGCSQPPICDPSEKNHLKFPLSEAHGL